MIQDIAPHTYDPVFRRKKPEDRDYLLHYEYNKVMLLKGEKGSAIPTFGELREEGEFSEQAQYLFSIDDRAYYCVTDMAVPEFGGFYMEPLTVFRNFEPLHQAFAGITGSQLYRWMQSRRFCGCCGSKTEPSARERALVCPSCGQTEYPKICPAVIVAITDGDRIILSRYRVSNNPYRGYALIAGFVEIGETFEDTVRREVMEEVGLKVKNIRYYKSQPWAFSDTEMIGFFAELDGDDTIRLQEDELSEAGWYHRDQVPDETMLNSIGSELKMVFKYGSMEKFYEATGIRPGE